MKPIDETKKAPAKYWLGKKRPLMVGNQYAKGHKPNKTSFFTGHESWNKGKKGLQKSWNKGKKGLQVAWNKGKKCPQFSGSNHFRWKGGITPENFKIRHSLEYKLWRKAVFERDGYVCIWCGDNTSGNLNADHIKPFALFPELRFAIDNGRTLCIDCHKTTDTYPRNLIKKT